MGRKLPVLRFFAHEGEKCSSGTAVPDLDPETNLPALDWRVFSWPLLIAGSAAKMAVSTTRSKAALAERIH